MNPLPIKDLSNTRTKEYLSSDTREASLPGLMSTVELISIVMPSNPEPSIITLLGIPDYQDESYSYFRMSVTICQFTRRNIPEDLIFVVPCIMLNSEIILNHSILSIQRNSTA